MWPSHDLSGHPAHLAQWHIHRQLEAELLFFPRGSTLPSLPHSPSETQCPPVSKTFPTSKRGKVPEPLLCVPVFASYVLIFYWLHQKCFSNQISWCWRYVHKCVWAWGWFLLHLIPKKSYAVIQQRRFLARAGRLLEILQSLAAYCLVGVTLQNKPELWTLWWYPSLFVH